MPASTSIYEGTTAIQANDLIGRKIARESGQTVKAVIAEMRKVEASLAEASGDEFAAMRKSLSAGVTALEEAVAYIVATYGQDIKAASVGSVPFLKLLGIVAGGWQMGRAALVAARASSPKAVATRASIRPRSPPRASMPTHVPVPGSGPGVFGGERRRRCAGHAGRHVLTSGPAQHPLKRSRKAPFLRQWSSGKRRSHSHATVSWTSMVRVQVLVT